MLMPTWRPYLVLAIWLIAINGCPLHAQNVPVPPPGPVRPPISNIPEEEEIAVQRTEAAVPAAEPAAQAAAVSQIPEQEVESTLFDIYLGDSLRGMILVTYTDTWFEFESPADVLEQVKDIKNADRVLPLLAGRIEKSRSIPGVGSIRCDLRTFRIIIDLEAEQLQSQGLDLRGRVPDPEAGLSFQNRSRIAYSNDTTGDTDSAVAHDSVVGYKKFFGRMKGSFLNDQPYEVDETTLTGFVSDFEVRGGLLEARGEYFAPSLQMTGASLETSENLLLHEDAGRGSKFEIYVPSSRSRVEFFRGGRLLAVQIMDFGLREVDTTAFPQGSYDVDIIIKEPNGNVVTERRFFTKSGLLASRARPVYNLAAGMQRDEWDLQDTPIYQGGVRVRAADALELSGSAYGDDVLAIGSLGFAGLYRWLNLQGVLSGSTKGDSGVSGGIGLSLPWEIGLDANGSKTLNLSEYSRNGLLQEAEEQPPDIDFDGFSPQRDRQDELLFQDQTSYTLGVYKSFGRFDIRYSANRNDTGVGSNDASSTQGPSATYRILDTGGHTLRLTGSWLQSDTEEVQAAQLGYRYRLTGELSLDAALAGRFGESDDEYILYGAVTYDDKDPNDRGLRATLSNDSRRTESPDSDSSTVTANQGLVDYTGDYLQTIGFVRRLSGSSNDSYLTGGNASNSFLVADDGTVALSYPVRNDSVFIADLESMSSRTPFDIIMNGQGRASVRAGQRIAIGVSPFQTYRIAIRPSEKAELVSYDTDIYQVTFFPGNVVKKRWSIERVFIVIGRAITPAGAPIAWQRLRGPREYVATEEDGSFQAEISGQERLYVDSRKYQCTLKLNLAERPEYLVDVGDVVCE